jgi:hypothetical protein
MWGSVRKCSVAYNFVIKLKTGGDHMREFVIIAGSTLDSAAAHALYRMSQ